MKGTCVSNIARGSIFINKNLLILAESLFFDPRCTDVVARICYRSWCTYVTVDGLVGTGDVTHTPMVCGHSSSCVRQALAYGFGRITIKFYYIYALS